MNVIVLQGTDLVRDYEQSFDKLRFIVKNHRISEDGRILIKEFQTEAEKKAYLQGFEDCEGWQKNLLLNGEKADEIADLLKCSKIYFVREDFYQKKGASDSDFKIFAGQDGYERALSYLIESADAYDSFIEFVVREGDFKTKDLYWEIEGQILQMWSADSFDIIETIREIGRYCEKFSSLRYFEKVVNQNVKSYYFEQESF